MDWKELFEINEMLLGIVSAAIYMLVTVASIIWGVHNRRANKKLKKSLGITNTAAIFEFVIDYLPVDSEEKADAWGELCKNFRPICIKDGSGNLKEISLQNPADTKGWFYLTPQHLQPSNHYTLNGKGFYEEMYYDSAGLATPMIWGLEIASKTGVTKEELNQEITLKMRFTQIGLGVRVPLETEFTISKNHLRLSEYKMTFNDVYLANASITKVSGLKILTDE